MVKWLQFFNVDDGESVIKQAVLEGPIDGSVGGHGGTAVDFYEPWFKVGVHHDIKPIEFEATFVVDDDLRGGNEGLNDEFLNLIEGFVSGILTIFGKNV